MSSQLKEFVLHPYDRKLETLFALCKKDLSRANYELIKEYDSVMVMQSLAKGTRVKHMEIVLNLSRMLHKDWKDTTKKDIEGLVYDIIQKYSRNSGQETNTTWDHKKILKIFFRWYKLGNREFREVGNPPETQWIRLKTVKDTISRENLLTEEDRLQLLNACEDNQRDRALLDVHYEAGTRPGEILSLRIKHVKFDKYGAVISVFGKTGARPIRLIRSVPNLAKWMESHPFKDNLESPLWIMFDKHNYGQPLQYCSAKAILRRRCEKARIKKRVTLKLFRHSEATRTANFLTEAQMRKRHGWTAESKMTSRYVHLVDADVDRAILEFHGVSQPKPKSEIMPKKCVLCDFMNSPDSEGCSKCGRPLDEQSAFKIEEDSKKKEKQVELLSDQVERLTSAVNELQKKST